MNKHKVSSNFKIIPFSKESLAKSLSNRWTTKKYILKNKYHLEFLFEHLSCNETEGWEVKTILIEKKYISSSYQSDYLTHYSSGFKIYSKFCKRIHFFSKSFTSLDEILIKEPGIWDSYKGYVTVKPLPKAPIGPVLLMSYPYTIKNPRIFCAIKPYVIEVLGKKIVIFSIPFQEQDEIVSSCATVALWSAIHMLNGLFQTGLLTLNDINAIANSNFHNSVSQSNGLDLEQICRVIRYLGFSVELRIIDSKNDSEIGASFVKQNIYAYLRMGLPVMVGIQLDDLGQHLITMVGYKKYIGEDSIANETSSPILYADQLSEYYAHDDQTGPFSRINFQNNEGTIATSRWKDFQMEDKYLGQVKSIIVPIPKNIRITFEDIYFQISSFEATFYPLIDSPNKFIWDIYLSKSEDYKAFDFSQSSINEFIGRENEVDAPYSKEQAVEILETFFPSYIWVARAVTSGIPSFELIFDATALPSSNQYCFKILFFDEFLKNLVFNIIFSDKSENSKQGPYYLTVLDSFLATLSNFSDMIIWNAMKEALALDE
jgi:hypothetical protein